MKFELRYIDDSTIDFHEMQSILWDLQRATREILNKTIQIYYDWDYRNSCNKAVTGEYLDIRAETGYKTLDGHVYNQLVGVLNCVSDKMPGALVNAAVQKAKKKYKSSQKDILRGTISIPSYKSDQPIIIPKTLIKLSSSDADHIIEFSLLSGEAKKHYSIKTGLRFNLLIKDGTQRAIIKNIIDGNYQIGESQIVYDKKKWFVLLTYSFVPGHYDIDPDKILGVDMGECYAIYASSVGEYERLRIEGGEVTAYAKRLEARKRSLQKQAAVAGDGRIGHGTKTRVAPAYKAEDRIANFRDTINHRYSKALVDFAVKNHYGVIQMEDLSGIKEDTGFPKLLRHWTYYDLQKKIANKAKEHGITFIKVDPRYTSQRCSVCGYISRENRPSQAKFVCQKCGFSTNADFNASQNLSIRNIDRIIKKTIGANAE